MGHWNVGAIEVTCGGSAGVPYREEKGTEEGAVGNTNIGWG